MRKKVKWILLGVLLGTVSGKLLFPAPTTGGVPRAPVSGSLLENTTRVVPAALALPEVAPLNYAAALEAMGRPEAPLGADAAELYLGFLRMAETEDLSRLVACFNAASGDHELKELAASVFRQAARRDPKGAFFAAQDLKDERLGKSMMAEVLETWAATDAEAVLAFMETLPAALGQDRNLLATVLRSMAAKDPVGALLKGEQLGDRMFEHSVIDAWVARDHSAAMDWLLAVEDPGRRDRLVQVAMGSMAVQDPEEALAISLSLPSPHSGRHPAQVLIEQWVTLPFPDSIDRAMGALTELPEDLLDERFVRSLAMSAALRDPDRAIGYAEEFEAEEARTRYLEGVISQVAYKDPVKASSLTSHLPDGGSLADAYSAIMRSWTKTDEFAAAQWLAELAPSASKDRAIQTFSDELVPIDPERAAQWASSIHDPDRRAGQIDRVVSQWKKVDASSAAAWVESEGVID